MRKTQTDKRTSGGKHKQEPLGEAMRALEEQREYFRKKFGREPEPGDPLFFDPDVDTPIALDQERINAQLTQAMASAGLDPCLIYAFRRTGLIVTEDNLGLLSQEDLAEWNAAIEEYEAKLKTKPS